MSEVYLGIYECPIHHYVSICVDPLSDHGGTRLTPSKCCGRWELKKRWKVDAKQAAEAILDEVREEGDE